MKTLSAAISAILILTVCGCGPSIKFNGEEMGYTTYEVNGQHSCNYEGDQVAKLIWEAANRHPNLLSISVCLEFTGKVTDDYGKVKKLTPSESGMGEITCYDLGKVRKYELKRFCEVYGNGYSSKIKSGFYSYLLPEKD